mmetsp:Transcript_4432/g.3718  ORF Transcript_4432/g.3718 Transcript_4432/m.3718 type:complete len:178 (+) Transcript_4432:2-535(+)
MTLLNKQRALLLEGQKKRVKKASRKQVEQKKQEDIKALNKSFGEKQALSPEEQKKRQDRREFRIKYRELWTARKNKIMLRDEKYKPKQEIVEKEEKVQKKSNEVERSLEKEKKREKFLKKIRSPYTPERKGRKSKKRNKVNKVKENVTTSKTFERHLDSKAQVKYSVLSSFVRNMNK